MNEGDEHAWRAANVASFGDRREQRELHELISQRVTLRFTPSAEDFAARLLELAREPARLAGRSLRDHVAGLGLDDLYLATACLRGDERAWNEFSAAHFDFMREFARRFLPPPAARDVADQMIAELWTRGRLRQYEGRSTLRTWLGAVVAHAALNSRKSMGRLVPLDSEPGRAGHGQTDPAESSEPASEQAAVLLREMFSEAVRALPPEDRLSLQLYYEQGMTLEELSVLLRASSAAVSRRLKRTRENLRAAIEALSRRRTGESAQSLRAGMDLARIELDLGKLFGGDPVASGERRGIV